MIANAIRPTEDDSEMAVESNRTLVRLLAEDRASFRVTIESAEGKQETISVPASAMRLLSNVLAEMANGNAITLIPIHAELTTQEAADLLNVSRPYLIGLLDQGKIPFHKTGTHRRIRYDDLMEYKRVDDIARHAAAAALTAQTRELGLEY